MSTRDDKKDLTEDVDAKKADTKLTDEPGPDFRVASEGESEEEHRLTTDSPRWGEEGSSREERGYPREGEEERRAGEQPPERNLPPRK